ncbi:MAG: response regulator transcription factor [Colwellia sp.]|nr:response regulator transcription factor [Colwellia sp.]
MLKLMIVEDDKYARLGLHQLFEQEGYHTQSYQDAEKAWEYCQQAKPDICILDRALPKMSGEELCILLRKKWPSLPILFLSGKGAESEQIEGLELGADDYITKPFSVKELLARVNAMCRRIPLFSSSLADSHFEMDDLLIDPKQMVATRGNDRIELTSREISILTLLYNMTGKRVSRDELFNECWGRNYFANSRSLDQYISCLRAKIERDPKNPLIVKTARGVGYWYG